MAPKNSNSLVGQKVNNPELKWISQIKDEITPFNVRDSLQNQLAAEIKTFFREIIVMEPSNFPSSSSLFDLQLIVIRQ
jgi:hypothetical protein